jgi:NADH-quinone oxidoreductase subunit A
MPSDYLPLFVFGLMALALPLVTLGVLRFLRPSRPNPAKAEAYECGIPAESNARARYSVQFAVVAIVFVLFDAEAVMLFPWAVRYRSLGWFGVMEALFFLAVLAVGYVWARQKGAFEWN